MREAIGGAGPETLRKNSLVGTFFKPQPSKLIGILKRTLQVDPQSCFTRKQVADFKFESGGAKVFLKIFFNALKLGQTLSITSQKKRKRKKKRKSRTSGKKEEIMAPMTENDGHSI